MNINRSRPAFDASELSSRKLWQIVNTATDQDVSASELEQAIAELAARRSYLAELRELGKLRPEEIQPGS